MYLKTCLLIVLSFGVMQAKVYKKMPSFRPPIELVKELKVREPFKCYSCIAESEATCEKKEKLCKQDKPICATETGIGYALQCADMEYYNEAKQYCEKSNKCQVTYCTESLCN